MERGGGATAMAHGPLILALVLLGMLSALLLFLPQDLLHYVIIH